MLIFLHFKMPIMNPNLASEKLPFLPWINEQYMYFLSLSLCGVVPSATHRLVSRQKTFHRFALKASKNKHTA